MHRMGLNPFFTFYIEAMLNFNGDVDANVNANVKCEQTLTLRTKSMQFRWICLFTLDSTQEIYSKLKTFKTTFYSS